MENTNNLKRQGEALIPAIAYGDAAGLPVETRSADYIAEHHGYINRLIPTSENPYYPGEHKPGLWSDDTQLSIAVAEGLIDADGFDIASIADAHIRAYDATKENEKVVDGKVKLVKRGWGGSTTAALEKLKAGVDPLLSGTPDGAGNGVLMKMAPLVFWQVARGTSPDERYDQYDELTAMTHYSKLARLCTRVHGDVLAHLLSYDYKKAELLAMLDESITANEFETGLPGAIRDLLSYLHSPELDQRNILAHTDGKGFHVPQTMAMAYGAFMGNQAKLFPAVFEAVNLGGDTDSIASIVSSMSIFAKKGPILLPHDYLRLHELGMLRKVSKELAHKALRL